MSHPEFLLVHPIFYSEWAHCSAICLVKLLGISLQMDLDSNDVAARTGNRSIIVFQQCYEAINILGLVCVYGPAVIPTVNDLWWRTALGFSLFTTYHITSIESKALTVCPDEGVVIWTASSLTTGVISDNRATVETIKAFEVNRIVYSEYFEVDLWARNGLDLVMKVVNTTKCRRL